MKRTPASILCLLAFQFISFSGVAQSEIASAYHSYSSVGLITPAGDFVFFVMSSDAHGLELWRSDGSTEGTSMVRDINAGPYSSGPSQFQVIGNTLYFVADDGIHGNELWRSDGSTAGTYMVSDVTPGGAATIVNKLYQAEGRIFFEVDQDSIAVWESDGTREGTTAIKSDRMTIQKENFVDLRYIIKRNKKTKITPTTHDEIVLRGKTYFTASTKRSGTELWQTDGTRRGTSLVKDIHLGQAESYITSLTKINNFIYFSAYDGVHGSEVWRTDGTTEGTKMVKDILKGPASALPRNFTPFKDKVLFSIVGYDGIQLWITDGSPNGTTQVFPGTEEPQIVQKEIVLPVHDPREISVGEDGTVIRKSAEMKWENPLGTNVSNESPEIYKSSNVRIRVRKGLEADLVARD